MAMKIPETLKVGGLVYKIVHVDSFMGSDSQYSGLAKHSTACIEIARECPDGSFDKQKIEECFMHELLHCIDSVYNNQKLDEDTIGRLSQGLYQVLKDNKIYCEDNNGD